MENNLDIKVDSFAPPFGYYTSKVLHIAKEIGYKNIYVQKPIINIFKKNNRNEVILRNSVYSIDSLNSIKRKSNKSFSELAKENFIHRFSFATPFVKKSFDI